MSTVVCNRSVAAASIAYFCITIAMMALICGDQSVRLIETLAMVVIMVTMNMLKVAPLLLEAVHRAVNMQDPTMRRVHDARTKRKPVWFQKLQSGIAYVDTA